MFYGIFEEIKSEPLNCQFEISKDKTNKKDKFIADSSFSTIAKDGSKWYFLESNSKGSFFRALVSSIHQLKLIEIIWYENNSNPLIF